MTKANGTQPKDRIAWGRYLLLFGVAAWMFVLGILVGRGTAPVRFDTQALQKELIALRESMVKKERDAVEKAMRGENNQESVEFYEALKEDGPDTSVKAGDQSKAGDRQAGAPPHKTRAAIMAKKSAVTIKSAPRPTATTKSAKPAAPPRKDELTIQVAALKDGEAAERIVANLKKDGYPAYLSRTVVDGKGLWFRVRVGRYADDKRAAADMARLARDRKDPILVRMGTD